jgi:tetratricopeptide (TPR) repeat protein
MISQLPARLLFLCLLLACSPTKQIEKRYTSDDKLVFDLIERIKKNPNDAEAAKLLPEAYQQAAEVRKNINRNTFENMSEGDRWIEISKQLQVAEQMYEAIRTNPVLRKIVPNPWDPTLKIQEAKQKAAEEYYNQGQDYLTYNNRPYAQKAYDMFVKANNAYPNYKDVRNLMEEARQLATIKVLVTPVNYYNSGWNHWGFNNDYLQYKMVRELNNSSYRNVHFYTDADINSLRIQPDRLVELTFTDLYIGTALNDSYTINRSKQIKIGETKSNPPQPIYETVKATVYVNRRILQSRAALHCRIYDWATGRNIMSDRFPDNYTWRQESARYTGDSRALEPSDWTLINNSGSSPNPPSRYELAQRLVDNCYSQLLSRIRSGVSFDY